MSIKFRTFSNLLTSAIIILLLVNPLRAVSASRAAAPTPIVVKPATIVSTRGSTVGAVASLRTQDQSGTLDTPTKYVVFQTPGVTYQGYRTFTVPTSVSPGTVTGITVKANYKGPVKASQAWSWSLYDWVHSAWVKVGDNAGATLNVWRALQFTAPGDARRFINNSTRQVRLQLTSNNAVNDAKLDYEAITLTYAVCSDPLGCVRIPPPGSVHIAYLLNRPSLDNLNGAMIAVDDAGTILGRPIQFDGASRADCDTAGSLADATKLIADASIVAILGTSCSGEARAILPSVSAAGFSMISPSNTGADLTEPGTAGYLRVSWSDSQQGEVAAEYAHSLGLTKAATIKDGTSYSNGNVQSFETAFQGLGGTITGQKEISPDQVDMRSELTYLASGSPELVYAPIFMPAAGYFVNQARVTPGLKIVDSVYLMGTDSLLDPWLVLSTGNDLEGLRLTNIDWMQFSSDYTATGGYIDKYMAKYGPKPSVTTWGPFGYDAFNVLKNAIVSAAVLQGDGSYIIGRQALRTALYGTTGFAGLTGTLTCHANGDCAETPAIGVYQYSAGVEEPTRIWPVMP